MRSGRPRHLADTVGRHLVRVEQNGGHGGSREQVTHSLDPVPAGHLRNASRWRECEDVARFLGKLPAKAYRQRPMTPTIPRRRTIGFMALATLVALLLLALASAGSAGAERAATSAAVCPLTASELSGILAKPVQRVNLSDPESEPTSQCSFSAVVKSATARFVSPQVFLTLTPGGATDLRDLYRYYLRVHARLATNPQVLLRPDLGSGAFTLASATVPVTTAFFLLANGNVATLVVDLSDAGVGKRDRVTADKIIALGRGRLH